MFSYDPSVLAEVEQTIRTLVKEKFPGPASSFALPAVIAKLYGPYDNEIKWANDYYYADKTAPLIPKLAKLYDALVKKGHDVANSYEISSCDRYVAYVPHDSNAKVMVFCNQNVTYLVVLVPQKVYRLRNSEHKIFNTYTMHIRFITDGPLYSYSRDYEYFDPETLDYEDILKGCHLSRYKDTSSKYFRYHDFRDCGYVITLRPEDDDFRDFYHVANTGGVAYHYIIDELCAYGNNMEEMLEELGATE